MMTTDSTHLVTLDNKRTLAEAARMVGMSPSGVFRWIRDGVAGVHLEHIRLGARIYTSGPALEAFGRAVAEAKTGRRSSAHADTRHLAQVEAGL